MGKHQQSAAKQEANSNNKPKEEAQNEEDKYKQFENEGVVFKAKLIGSELVMEPRGDKMCQNSIQRLKAIIKGTNSHKKRIVLKISFDGVKIYDEKSCEMLHHHEVAQISYIASDDTDNRTFGYVSDVPAKAHLFICFKTTGPAINVMSVISSLFEATLEKKNRDKKREKDAASTNTSTTTTNTAAGQQIMSQESMDLIGDSGIVECDGSIIGDTSRQASFQAQTSSILNSFVVPMAGDSFNNSSITTAGNSNNKQVKQSVSTADLLFDDLFAGFSDPIIVDKNDSLISYKPDMSNASASQLAGLTIPNSMSTTAAVSPSKFTLAESVTRSSIIGSNSAGIPPGIEPMMVSHPNSRPHQSNSGAGANNILLPPSSLPRPSPFMKQSGPSQNRSLVYNHSSVSLSDAALTRQPTLTSNTQHHHRSTTNDNYMDRYAVFNDIDSLPSIFESTSLGNVNKVNSTNKTSTTMGHVSSINAESNMFRQRNPFDDDFFA